jgi:hypothetical protein
MAKKSIVRLEHLPYSANLTPTNLTLYKIKVHLEMMKVSGHQRHSEKR